jgi:lipid-binding SYLF domain-containing protein
MKKEKKANRSRKKPAGVTSSVPRVLPATELATYADGAGPVGRDASAETDATMKAQILSYSRANGVFAGVSLEGSTIRSDDDGNKALYGKQISAKDIVNGGAVQTPADGQPLVGLLQKTSPKHAS